MTDVNPIESDSLREWRRIGPIAQAVFTLAFAVAACAVAVVLMGSTAASESTDLAPALQQLAAAPTLTPEGIFVPSAISSADIQPEALPPTF